MEGGEQVKSGTLIGQLSRRAMTSGREITLVLLPSLQKIILLEKLARKFCQDLCDYKTVLLDFPLLLQSTVSYELDVTFVPINKPTNK